MNIFKIDLLNRAFKFSVGVIGAVSRNRNASMAEKIIYKQIIRSSTSIGANITEAQGGASRKDFTNYINHAFKSAKETVYWLELLKKVSEFHRHKISCLIKEVNEIVKILASSLISLRKK